MGDIWSADQNYSTGFLSADLKSNWSEWLFATCSHSSPGIRHGRLCGYNDFNLNLDSTRTFSNAIDIIPSNKISDREVTEPCVTSQGILTNHLYPNWCKFYCWACHTGTNYEQDSLYAFMLYLIAASKTVLYQRLLEVRMDIIATIQWCFKNLRLSFYSVVWRPVLNPSFSRAVTLNVVSVCIRWLIWL